jgi:predicted small lipoprotein YifL
MAAQAGKGKILTSPCLSIQGAPALSRDRRPFLRLALIGALAASFALAACGRKGPLDPPPSASVAGEQAAPAAPAGAQVNRGPIGPDLKPIAPGMRDKPIPLDVLLN